MSRWNWDFSRKCKALHWRFTKKQYWLWKSSWTATIQTRKSLIHRWW